MTKDDVHETIRLSARRVGNALGLTDADYLPVHELLSEIEQADKHARGLLKDFTVAYLEWFEVTSKIKEVFPGGAQSDPKATSAWAKAVERRDSTRAALKTWISSRSS